MNSIRSEARLVHIVSAIAGLVLAAIGGSCAVAQNYPPSTGLGNDQRGYGQPPGGSAIRQPGFGNAQPSQGPSGLDELMAWERQDMRVAPKKTLHNGPMHGATPNQIPGGQVITTKGLVALLQNPQGVKALVFDVLGGPQQLPNAIPAVAASQPGSFSDQTQQQFGQWLKQVTGGSRDTPLVFYCQGPQCWMSYNAALRAVNLGYKNVLWYRGGIEAWERAGLPLAAGPSGGGAGGPSGGQPGGYAGGQPGGYPGGQPGGYPGGQPGGYAGGQPGGYPGGQPGGYPGGQPGGYPGGQPGGYPGGQPGGYPGGQPGGYPGGQPGGYPGGQPGGYPGGQPGGYPYPGGR